MLTSVSSQCVVYTLYSDTYYIPGISYRYDNSNLYIYKAEKLSVCPSLMPVTRKLKHVLKWDFDYIKRSSSGKTKFVITNCYLLPFILYRTLKALV